ncbi:MAG: class I SAM-dependent methyltransferase [Solirubrobacteraceae bacterium]
MSADATCNVCSTLVSGRQAPVWVKDGFDIVRCGACGLVFRRELPAPAELAEIYAEEYFRRPEEDAAGQGYSDYLADEQLHRLNGALRARKLGALAEPGRLFDVGAAAGFFMDEASRRGWDVAGIDVSPQMSGWGRERLGLNLSTGEFRAADLVDASYDAVSMWDYIEHSLDPVGDLNRARALLRPGGVLAISTGDSSSFVARLSGRRWHLLTPRHHNFFFSARTLASACERAGLEVVSTGYPAARYSLGYLAFKLRSMAPENRVIRRLGDAVGSSRAGRVALPVNLWDIVTLFARRPPLAADGDVGARGERHNLAP